MAALKTPIHEGSGTLEDVTGELQRLLVVSCAHQQDGDTRHHGSDGGLMCASSLEIALSGGTEQLTELTEELLERGAHITRENAQNSERKSALAEQRLELQCKLVDDVMALPCLPHAAVALSSSRGKAGLPRELAETGRGVVESALQEVIERWRKLHRAQQQVHATRRALDQEIGESSQHDPPCSAQVQYVQHTLQNVRDECVGMLAHCKKLVDSIAEKQKKLNKTPFGASSSSARANLHDELTRRLVYFNELRHKYEAMRTVLAQRTLH